MVALHAPPGLTSIEIVGSGVVYGGVPNQCVKCSGSVQAFQTSSRGASKTRVTVATRLPVLGASVIARPFSLFADRRLILGRRDDWKLIARPFQFVGVARRDSLTAMTAPVPKTRRSPRAQNDESPAAHLPVSLRSADRGAHP